MSGKEKYKGERYHFYGRGARIGKGGNGAVYDVNVEEFDYPIVAKFFEYEGNDKEIRYKRFKKEIEIIREMQDVEGIIPVIDRRCPQGVPQNKHDAWFMMPKADTYKVNRNNNVVNKLDDLIQLANVIEAIHKRGYAHRDIKPENILIFNGRVCLSDFGLIWGYEEERLTEVNDRIGPYKILPPELEKVQMDSILDFRPSDVYLFAKVLWMTLKEDNIGFRGQYQRGDIQIYLDKETYGAMTFEPIHKLMEEATYEDMKKRITIEKCIEYLKLQKNIFEEFTNEQLVRQLQYDEYSRKAIAISKPDKLVYEDMRFIYDLLGKIISISNMYIKNLYDNEGSKQIQVSDFNANSDGTCRLLYYNLGKKIKEYLLKIREMTYSKQDELVILELEDMDIQDQEYIPYSESQRGFGNMYSKIYFSSYEKLIITKSNLIDETVDGKLFVN